MDGPLQLPSGRTIRIGIYIVGALVVAVAVIARLM